MKRLSPLKLQSTPKKQFPVPKEASRPQLLEAAGDLVQLGVVSEAPNAPLKPLPLSEVAKSRILASRIPSELSPDGEWIAYGVLTSDVIKGDQYTPTGVPLTEGRNQRELRVTHTELGDTLEVGAPGTNSWGPVWSPDGKKMAYFSDESGVAQTWVWDREKDEKKPLGSFVARPHFGFETMSWTPDGKSLLVESKPGMEPLTRDRKEVQEAEKNDPLAYIPVSDLILLDLETEESRVLAEGVRCRKYTVSPDGKKVAYIHVDKAKNSSQGHWWSCHVVDLETNESFALATNLSLCYGREWEWSPNSDALAFLTDKEDGGRLLLAELGKQEIRELGKDVPNLDTQGWGQKAPVWGPEGRRLYVSDEEKMWSFDVASGKASVVAERDGWNIHSLARTSFHHGPWGQDGQALLVGLNDDRQTRVWALDPRTHETTDVATIDKSASIGQSSLRSSQDGKSLFFIGGGDRENYREMYRLDTTSGETSKISQINSEVEGGKGKTRLVSWQTKHGKTLEGSILLPPDYKDGPLPMVTFAYGGIEDATEYANFYGFYGERSFDAHVLSTRGYAVFIPSTPFREKKVLEDVSEAVISGVEAMVEQGYADPDRLALMGQSFGAFNTWGVLTRTDMFEAAVTTANVTHPDLSIDFKRAPGYHQAGQSKMRSTPQTDPEAYRANSPLHDFSNITTPLLMAQGTEDGLEVAEFTFEALKKLGKDVELKIYEDEGHVIQSPANVVDFWQRRLDFLDQHLTTDENIACSL